jgi:hypothetical protein
MTCAHVAPQWSGSVWMFQQLAAPHDVFGGLQVALQLAGFVLVSQKGVGDAHASLQALQFWSVPSCVSQPGLVASQSA